MKAEELWNKYLEQRDISKDTVYTAWQFGGAPDLLKDLVLKGVKTATASLSDLYPYFNEAVPEAGDYSVILDSKDEAVCIIRTVRTYVVPFGEVSEEHAHKEGEGDLSLEYWRRVHEEFFEECVKDTELSFDCDSKVLCEEFEVVFRADEIC